jgi:hypothetical protein
LTLLLVIVALGVVIMLDIILTHAYLTVRRRGPVRGGRRFLRGNGFCAQSPETARKPACSEEAHTSERSSTTNPF